MGLTSILLVIVFFIPIVSGVFTLRYSRKLSLTLFSIPFIFMLIVGGWWLYEANHRFIGSTDLADEQIADVKLQMRATNAFKKTHGDYKKEDNVRFGEYLIFDTFAIGTDLETDEIVYIETTDEELQTAKGVQVGDDEADVIQQYGEKYYKSNEMGEGKTMNFVDRDASIHLQFWLKDGDVFKIAMYTM